MRILLSEGSSLTAREFVTVLGLAGQHLEVMDPSASCLCRFSRWVRAVHRAPASGADPLSYLDAVSEVLRRGRFDVLLPTHEQAWLFAAARDRLPDDVGLAVADPSSFQLVQSKVAFAKLLDEVGLPQPRWAVARTEDDFAEWRPPFYLKAPYSTAGQGVREVASAADAVEAFTALSRMTEQGELLIQEPAGGTYAQVQALFDHGRLIAAHTSARSAEGVGHSAAGRVSVNHGFARHDVEKLGRHLGWHGGLTLDYLFDGDHVKYIECNPRTVEPGNAAASGVDLPAAQARLSLGEHPAPVPPGRTGVRTHGAVAVLLGSARYAGTRRAVLGSAWNMAAGRDGFKGSREQLTPLWRDPPSALPLAAVLGRLLIRPRDAQGIAEAGVSAYSVGDDSIQTVLSAGPATSPAPARDVDQC